MQRAMAITFLLCTAPSWPLRAQIRPVVLTGAPLAVFADPFSSIVGVRGLPGDRAIVVDRTERKVMLAHFADGRATPIGREGSGPGEYRFPSSALAGPNNTTWTSDPSQGRIVVISAEGKAVETHMVPSTVNGFGPTVPKGIDAKGRLYFARSSQPAGAGSMDALQILRWDPPTGRVDTIGQIASGLTVKLGKTVGQTTAVSIGAKPWTPVPAWAPLPDGRVVVVQPVPYRVDFLESGGRVTRGPVHAHQPIAVTAADRKAYRDALRPTAKPAISRAGRGASSTPPQATAPEAATEIPDSDFPATKPPFPGSNAVLVTPEGNLWVLRTRAAGDNAPKYDIFTSAGQLTGQATLKPNSTVVGFGPGVVYVSRQDPADDLRYLEMYRR